MNGAARKKPAWHVYRKLGTPDEREASKFAEVVTGQKLDHVPYTGVIRD